MNTDSPDKSVNIDKKSNIKTATELDAMFDAGDAGIHEHIDWAGATQPEVDTKPKKVFTVLEVVLMTMTAGLFGLLMVSFFVLFYVTSDLCGPEYFQTFSDVLGEKHGGLNDVAYGDVKKPGEDLSELGREADKEKSRSTRDKTKSSVRDPSASDYEEAQRKANNAPPPPKSGVTKVEKDGTKKTW